MSELFHHGIPNQKWGIQNGPPYPLSREDHTKVVRSGDIKTMREHITEFKDWEIEQAIRKFNYNQKLDELIGDPKTKKGEKAINKFVRKISNVNRALNPVVDTLGTIAKGADHSIRIYNSIANTMNSLKGKKMKTIRTGGSKDNKEKKD